MNMNTTILICTLGKTPQVITETVWALAHASAPIIPDEIIAISTANYAANARDRLFASGGGWSQLLKALKRARIDVANKLRFEAESIRVAADEHGEIQDLRTVKDNERFSDCVFKALKTVTDGVDAEDVQVILSISGGRKSMVAITSVAMSLLARPQDRMIHVIVDQGLEDKNFHFPKSGAGFSLFDVPFVRTRGLLKGVDVGRVRTFDACRLLTQERVQDVDAFPTITLNVGTGHLRVGAQQSLQGIDGARFLLLLLVMRYHRLERRRFDEFMGFVCGATNENTNDFPKDVWHFDWFARLRKKDNVVKIAKLISETRKFLCEKSKVVTDRQGLLLLPKSANSHSRDAEIGYPKEKLKIVAPPGFLTQFDAFFQHVIR